MYFGIRTTSVPRFARSIASAMTSTSGCPRSARVACGIGFRFSSLTTSGSTSSSRPTPSLKSCSTTGLPVPEHPTTVIAIQQDTGRSGGDFAFSRDIALGTKVRVRVPGREVILAAAPPAGLSLHNVLTGRVSAIQDESGSGHVVVQLQIGKLRLLAEVTQMRPSTGAGAQAGLFTR